MRKAANHLYQKARRDGLTIANIGSGFVSNGLTEAPGVNFDVDKFIYLGSGNSNTTYVFITRSAAGFDNIEKLRLLGNGLSGAVAPSSSRSSLGRCSESGLRPM